MKKLILSAILLAFISVLNSCTDELAEQIAEGSSTSTSMDDSVEQVPQAILDYVAANYSGIEVLYAETENDDDNANIAFEVHLANGTDVYFDANGTFLFDETDSDSDDDDIAVADLPQVILDYVAANYPGLSIVDANSEDNGAFEVELSNDLDLYFDANGNLIGIETDDESDDDNDDDNDGDSDDDNVAIGDLPQAILDYVAANYPNASIESAHLEDDGGFEVELNNNLNLYFDASGNFLFAETDSSSGG